MGSNGREDCSIAEGISPGSYGPPFGKVFRKSLDGAPAVAASSRLSQMSFGALLTCVFLQLHNGMHTQSKRNYPTYTLYVSINMDSSFLSTPLVKF